MHLVSFDIFRTLGFPNTTVLKPDQFLRHKERLREADWVLFPEYWRRYCECTDVLYAQEYLPLDRDARVVVIGDQVLTAYWRTQADQGFYNNVARGGRIDMSPVPRVMTDLALRLAR